MKGLVIAAATALLASVSAAAIATPALADAVVTRQTTSTPFSDTGLTDGCHPGATGTITGIATVTEHSVQTADGFHVEGTEVDSGRIDWTDGTYTIIGSTDHFAFNTTAGTTLNTDAHVDFGDNYSADGVLLFHTTFHSASHFTMTNGVITRVAFDFNHDHIFGSDCTS